jgi:hypothetical protein
LQNATPPRRAAAPDAGSARGARRDARAAPGSPADAHPRRVDLGEHARLVRARREPQRRGVERAVEPGGRSEVGARDPDGP